MQKQDTQNPGENARVGFSRRVFLRSAAASAAIAVPAVADASNADRLATDEERLNGCIAELKAILARMHPGFEEVGGEYIEHGTGGASITLSARQPDADGASEWGGNGPYWVDGRYPHYITGGYFIRREWSEIDRRFHLIGRCYSSGEVQPDPVVICPSTILAKLWERPAIDQLDVSTLGKKPARRTAL